MLDASAPATVPAPGRIPNDPILSERRRNELWNAAVAAVGEHISVLETETLDPRTAIVDRIVAVTWTGSIDGDDAEIRAPYETWRLQDQRWFFDFAAAV